jgi:hypothetical protein
MAAAPGLPASSFVSQLKTYCLARKSTGWKVIVLTLLAESNSPRNVLRNQVNVLIRADNSFYDGLADIAADPTIGIDAAAFDTSLYSDGIHPTALGQSYIKPIVKPVVVSLLP